MELPEKPLPALLRDYRQLAGEDNMPIYVVVFNNNWVPLNYLPDERDATEYYYIDSLGYIGYGANALQDFQQKQTALRSVKPARRLHRGKHGVKIKRDL